MRTSKGRRIRDLPTPIEVRAIFRRAVRDQQRILNLWPNAKKEKKKFTSQLGFPEATVEFMKQKGMDASAIEQVKRAQLKAARACWPTLHEYRPVEYIHANLQQCWIPFSALLLSAAAKLPGNDFGELKPKLKECGFPQGILNFFREDQKRKYFRQQTPVSVATMIVTRLNPGRFEEETIRRARLYPHLPTPKS